MSEWPLIAVLGPTGSGKSELALAAALELSGEIVNCDSVQIYRHFDLGSAKLAPGERRGVPHHMLDIVDPDQPFTAGEYARRARQALDEIVSRRRVPVVVGGTGFYLRALLDGLFPGPARDAALRERLAAREARRPGSLHKLLRRFDAAAAGRIHARDVNKVVRALEVCLVARRPISELFAQGRDALRGFRVLKIALNPPRAALFERLDSRCQRMFELGLADEARRILALGFSPGAKPFESLGYRQALQLVNGQLSAEEALYHMRRETRRYAKRQWTWFRRERDVEWYDGFGDDPVVQRVVLGRLSQFTNNFPEIGLEDRTKSRVVRI